MSSLQDLHRDTQRRDGGEYTPDNTETIDPVEHMKRHGNYKERDAAMDQLKMLFDGYKQIQKLRMKVNNQILAMDRGTDKLDEIDQEYINSVLTNIEEKEEAKGKLIAQWVKTNKTMPIVSAMLSVKGIGPVTVAACLTYLDIRKADHPSSFWSYAGYRCASYERYKDLPKDKWIPIHDKNTGEPVLDKKGKQRMSHHNPGNQTLRNALYVSAGCFVKNADCEYRGVYDRRKAKTSQSEKLTQTRMPGKTGTVEKMWKDVKPGHRHGDAIRVMMKCFLADLWYVWRTLEGLPVNDLYVKEHLGHESGIIDPEKMGWKY
jgi:hypothetical protein